MSNQSPNPFRMAPLPGRHYFVVCPLVSSLCARATEISREMMLERGLRVDHTTIYRSRPVLCSGVGSALPSSSEVHDRLLESR